MRVSEDGGTKISCFLTSSPAKSVGKKVRLQTAARCSEEVLFSVRLLNQTLSAVSDTIELAVCLTLVLTLTPSSSRRRLPVPTF